MSRMNWGRFPLNANDLEINAKFRVHPKILIVIFEIFPEMKFFELDFKILKIELNHFP